MLETTATSDLTAIASEPFWALLLHHWAALLTAALLLIFIPLVRRIATNRISDSKQRYKLRKLITYGGMALIVVFVLIAVSDQAARLSVVLGAIGAATVFALQEVVASIAGWIALSSGDFYDPGDRVQLGGIKGDVIDIGLLRTTLMETGAWVDGDLYSGRVVRIANSSVFKEPVFNYSSDFPFVWDEIKLPVRYGSDVQLAKKVIFQAAHDVIGRYTVDSQKGWKELTEKYLIEHAKLEPTVTARANENWVECTLRYIVDYKLRRSTADKITNAILEGIDATDGMVLLASARAEQITGPTISSHN